MSHPHQPGHYQRALDTADEYNLPGLAIDPADRCIRAVNGTFEQVFGWSNAELEGVDHREIVEDDDHASVHAMLSVLSFGGTVSSETVELLDVSGDARETTWVGVPNLGDERGGVVAVFCRPTSWSRDSLPGALDALQDGEGEEAWVDRVLDVDDEREGRHSRSFWE